MQQKTLWIAAFFLALVALAPAAYAVCSNPAGSAGEAMYNSTHDAFQYCDGSNWVAVQPEVQNCLPFEVLDVPEKPTTGQGMQEWVFDGIYSYSVSAHTSQTIYAYTFDGAKTTLTAHADLSASLGGRYWDIHTDGTYLYVATLGGGMGAINFDGSSFAVLDTDSPGGNSWVSQVTGDGTYIYAMTNGQLHAYTFDGTTLTYVASSASSLGSGDENGLIYADGTLFASFETTGVVALTFNGTSFTVQDTWATSGESDKLYHDGTYVYVADGSAGVKVASYAAGSFTEIDAHATIHDSLSIDGDGTNIFVGTAGGIEAFTFDGTSLSFNHERPYSNSYKALRVNAAGFIFTGGDGGSVDDHVLKYNPDASVGTITTQPTFYRVKKVWYEHPYLYSAANGAGVLYAHEWTGTGFTLIDTYTTSASGSGHRGVEAVYSDGTYVYITVNDQGDQRVEALSFNGTNFSFIDKSTLVGERPKYMHGDGSYIYVASTHGPSPTDRRITALSFDGTTLTQEAFTDGFWAGDDVFTDGTYIFHPYAGDLYIGTFDGTSFTTVLDTNAPPDSPSGVWYDGTYVYLVTNSHQGNYDSAIHVYSFNGTTLTWIDSMTMNGNGWPHVFGSNGKIFMTDESNGIHEFTFDGTSLTHVSTIAFDEPKYMWVDNNYRFAALNNTGIAHIPYDTNSCGSSSCDSPSGARGDLFYNTANHVLQYCSRGGWQALGPDGDGGAGCTFPDGDAGDVVYNTTHNVLQYCEGDAWIGIGK